jgi:hypothetical protein
MRILLGAGLVFTSIWASYQGQSNYPILASYTGQNPYVDARTIVFNNFYRPVGCAFDVYTLHDPADPNVVVDVNIPSFTAVQGATVPDPNGTGYLTEWRFDFDPPDPNQHNVDIFTTGNTCRPQIRPGRGIVMAPPRDPNYDYALARTDPIAYQKAKKHQQRWEFLNVIGKWVNERVYWHRKCWCCGARGSSARTTSWATRKWNKRAK